MSNRTGDIPVFNREILSDIYQNHLLSSVCCAELKRSESREDIGIMETALLQLTIIKGRTNCHFGKFLTVLASTYEFTQTLHNIISRLKRKG